MQPSIAQRLIELNRKFYTDFGEAFSATRGRIQPGVRRVLDSLDGDEAILDLGCGNGELARTLARKGHRGAYLGLDFSLPLLADAESVPEGFLAEFREMDLTSELSVIASERSERGNPPFMRRLLRRSASRNDTFDIIFSFATLHHIPSQSLRLNILKSVHEQLARDGRFIHSNWQSLNSPRLKLRVREWSEAGLTEADVDENDYLLDWRSGGTGLRYVHHFSEGELAELAESSEFEIVETFYSDGKEGNLAIYQTWQKSS
jgi:tRNA (uracil-5-)-methyltransferase TRM9